jgi:hypothetical protein
MLLLVSGATSFPRSEHVGTLVVPKSWNLVDKLPLQPGRWAMDNGAFSGFDEGAFVRMLERFYGCTEGCLFVTVPDVVSDAASTLHLWPFWSRLIRGLGYPVAFVAQDGLTPEGVPWGELDVLFIGGSTHYKESLEVRSLCAYAKARGVWVHWGRVNSKRRYKLALEMGVDSIDGTGFSMYPDTNIPKAQAWETAIRSQPSLLSESSDV